MCALAGADMAEGLGMLNASTLLVPEQIIFDDEIYHTHRVLAEGIDVSPDGLALEVIAAVGPGGHFLAQKHTRQHVREIWIPGLTHPGPTKDEEPSLDIRRRARAKLDAILAKHQPEPLEGATQAEFQAILDAAAQELGA
jgi:trimethylamine--corrinoid protein Co-methyltransferase